MRNIFTILFFWASFAGAIASGVAMILSLFQPSADGTHFVECAIAFGISASSFLFIMGEVDY
jgi:hypothetical protein